MQCVIQPAVGDIDCWAKFMGHHLHIKHQWIIDNPQITTKFQKYWKVCHIVAKL